MAEQKPTEEAIVAESDVMLQEAAEEVQQEAAEATEVTSVVDVKESPAEEVTEVAAEEVAEVAAEKVAEVVDEVTEEVAAAEEVVAEVAAEVVEEIALVEETTQDVDKKSMHTDASSTANGHTMKAIYYERIGPCEEVALLKDLPYPRVRAANDVVVKVVAAGVNPVDYKRIEGVLGFLDSNPPIIAGLDFAGIVEEVGARVTKVKVGDAVWGKSDLNNSGSFAEAILVRDSNLTLKPENTTFKEAAALGVVALTGIEALYGICNLQEGQTVLIIGASGGTGTVGVQMAKALGAKVIGTCSERNVDFVKGLGADQVIDYTKEEWHEVLQGENIDAIYDCRGGPLFWDHSKQVIRNGGHFVTIVGDDAVQKPFTFGHTLAVGATIVGRMIRGVFTGPKYHFASPSPCEDHYAKINEWLSSDALSIQVDSSYSLEEMQEAFARQKSARARGKIVIVVDEGLADCTAVPSQ